MAGLPCPPEQWPLFSQLLETAMALPPEARPAWLAALTAEHAPLRAALANVLAQAALDSDPAFLGAPRLPSGALAAFSAGERIGPYRLDRELGQGGMGEVWLARRDDGALDRPVALKLPHAHLLSGPLRSRFERERNILAALSHPHIAQLYDAGISEAGHPYLAMEFVDGAPITR